MNPSYDASGLPGPTPTPKIPLAYLEYYSSSKTFLIISKMNTKMTSTKNQFKFSKSLTWKATSSSSLLDIIAHFSSFPSHHVTGEKKVASYRSFSYSVTILRGE